jgi:hypothetical protein
VEHINKMDRLSFSKIRARTYYNFHETFLPSGYPNSVSKGYLKFTIYSNISIISITAMSFLST